MSYTPTIIVEVESLNKHKELFENVSYGIILDDETRGGEEDKTVLETISELYFEKRIIKLFETEVKYFTPYFSSYNAQVRNKLNELNIKYVLLD